MKPIGILLILLGIVGIVMGAMMFGDIGIACIVGAMSALLSPAFLRNSYSYKLCRATILPR